MCFVGECLIKRETLGGCIDDLKESSKYYHRKMDALYTKKIFKDFTMCMDEKYDVQSHFGNSPLLPPLPAIRNWHISILGRRQKVHCSPLQFSWVQRKISEKKNILNVEMRLQHSITA